MERLKFFIIFLILAFSTSPSFAARQVLNESASPSSKGTLNTNFSNANKNFVELYAADLLKADASCFASESAFNSCFALDWAAGGVSSWSDVQALITGSGDYIKYDGTRGTPTGVPYIAGSNITISPDNVISATGTLSGTVDWEDVIGAPETTPITVSMITGLFSGTEDCLGSNGETVACGGSAGGIPHVSSGYPSSSGAWNFNTTDYKLYTRLASGDVYSTSALTLAAAADITPTGFAFTDVTNATLSTEYTACDQITGIGWPATVTASGGTAAICTGNNAGCGTFGTAPGTVENDGWVCARHTSSASNSTPTNTPVTVGTASDTFTTTTLAASVASTAVRNTGSGAGSIADAGTSIYDLSQNFTIEAWIYKSGNYSGSFGVIVGKGSNYQMRIPDTTLQCGVSSLGGAANDDTAFNALADGWHHIACTFSSTTGVSFYRGGQRKDNQSWMTGNIAANDDAVTVMGSGSTNYPFRTDEIRVSSTVRYTGTSFTVPTSPLTSDANTVGLFHLDETSGAILEDSSSNGVDASLSGTWSFGEVGAF